MMPVLRPLLALIALGLALLTASPARAHGWRWVECRPGGGPLVDMAVGPGKPALWLALHPTAGLFRSEDGGAHWEHAGDDLMNPWNAWWLTCVALNAEGDKAAIGTRESGLFLSADGGRSWHPGGMGFDLSVDLITCVRYDQRDEQHLLIGTNAGLFQSTDGGQSCQRCPLPVAEAGPARVLTIAFHPVDSLKVYVAIEDKGLFASNDGGRNWEAAGNGLIAAPECLSINPHVVGDALAGGPDGVARWRPDARRWVPMGAGLSRGVEVTTLLRLPGDGRRVLAGTRNGRLFLSRDGGDHWERLPGAPLQPGPLTLEHGGGGTVHLAGGGGAFRSHDEGQTWEPCADGLPPMAPRALTAPDRSGRLLVGGGGGLRETFDFGDTWRDRGEGLRGLQLAINDVRPDPRDARRLAAAGEAGVVLSEDGGATWRSSSLDAWTGALAWLPRARPAALVALGVSSGTTTAWRSEDSGATWRAVYHGPLDAGAWVVADTAGGTLFIGGDRLVRSDDGGKSWAELAPPAGTARVTALEPLPGRPDRVWIGTPAGLFESPDRGTTWARAGLEGRRVRALLTAGRGSAWRAALTSGGLHVSLNRGVTWRETPLPVGAEGALRMALDPSGQLLYLVTPTGMLASRLPPDWQPEHETPPVPPADEPTAPSTPTPR